MKPYKNVAEEATGVTGAGNYREVAREHGFKYLEVLDWTSSAGDWTFIVSNDRKEWQIMSQTNNWPRVGFTYHFSDEVFEGTKEEVFKQIEESF